MEDIVPTTEPALSKKPRDHPNGFSQFLLMVMGYEVLIQHRSMGEGNDRK